jgi:hypothetical protein
MLSIKITNRDMSADARKNAKPLLSKPLILLAGVTLAVLSSSCDKTAEQAVASGLPESTPGIAYTNYRVASVPWSIHVVRVARSHPELTLHSVHASAKALGLSTLSEQIRRFKAGDDLPVAGVNGDFYQRGRSYAGDPRGLQILEGDLISAPVGGVSFWIDADGQPHCTNVYSQFQVTWPDGATTPFGLNEERSGSRAAVLYTPALGASTLTSGGRELVLERSGEGPWLPLAPGQTYMARVRQVREGGNTRLAADTMVLSLGSRAMAGVPNVEPGGLVKLSTGTIPNLRGARTALSGGPWLVHNGRVAKPQRQNDEDEDSMPYSQSSMRERHPRAGLGWNDKYFFLLEVDGRQRHLSIGMTLQEMANFFVSLGCREALNFDGGGSATLWCNGQVRNSPCDRYERPIANGLIVVKKPTDHHRAVAGPVGQVKAVQP